MFSFVSNLYKDEDSKEERNVIDSSQAKGDFFAGMNVPPPTTTTECPSQSAFSFIVESNGDCSTSTNPSSFSFIQSTPAEPTAEEASKFSFLANTTETEDTSSFSFLNNTETDPNIIDISTVVKNNADSDGLHKLNNVAEPCLQRSDLPNPPESQIKLAKSALGKQVKKKKRATKVGFGREDDDADDGTIQSDHNSNHVPNDKVDVVSIEKGGGDEMIEKHIPYNDIPLNVLLAMSSPSISASNVAEQISSSNTCVTTSSSMPLPSTPPPAAPSPSPESVPTISASSNTQDIESVEPNSAQILQDGLVLEKTYTNSLNRSVAAMEKHPTASQQNPQETETTVQKLERKSREMLMQITHGLSDLSRLHTAAVAGQQRFKQEIDAEIETIKKSKARIEEAEKEQTRLAQVEDFEGADALNAEVEASEQEMCKHEHILGDLRVSVRLLEETFAQERSECVNNLHRAAASLQMIKEQLDLGVSQTHKSFEKQFSIEHARIEAELERIGLEKSHFEREKQALESDSNRTEEAILAQTRDLSAMKEEFHGSMILLDAEIKALQEQLALKQDEKVVLSANLQDVDGKIGEVRKKYDRQLQRICDRRSDLQKSKSECQEEEDIVLQEQSALEAQVAMNKSSSDQAKEWSRRLDEEVVVVDSFLKCLAARKSTPISEIASICSLEPADGDTDIEEIRRNSEAILYLREKKQASTNEFQVHRDSLLLESKRLGEQIPQLENEKKAYAAAKRFKEAAATSKSLKDIQSAKETIDADLDDVTNLIVQTELEISELNERYATTQQTLADARKNVDVARFEGLHRRAREIRSMIRNTGQCCKQDGTLFDETARPDLLGCGSVREATAMFLAIELGAVLREAKAIAELYDLVEPNMENEAILEFSCRETDKGNSSELSGMDTDKYLAEEIPAEEKIKEVNSSSQRLNAIGVPVDHMAMLTEEETNIVDVRNVVEEIVTTVVSEGRYESELVAEPAITTFDREASIAHARDLMATVQKLTIQMDTASDHEDYELAAELFETLSTTNEQLDQILELLCCSREYLDRQS